MVAQKLAHYIQPLHHSIFLPIYLLPTTNLPHRAGTFTVTLSASNGMKSPVVAMAIVDVDEKISGLELTISPDDPAVGETVFAIVSQGKISDQNQKFERRCKK